MLPLQELTKAVVTGLREHLGYPVIRQNQGAPAPAYPYTTYTITTLASENKGTWGEWADGMDRKLVKQSWSISCLSDNAQQSMALAASARTWLEHVGRVWLGERQVTVHTVGQITNRDNVLSLEYEYKNGFDVVFLVYDQVDRGVRETGTIETVTISNREEL